MSYFALGNSLFCLPCKRTQTVELRYSLHIIKEHQIATLLQSRCFVSYVVLVPLQLLLMHVAFSKHCSFFRRRLIQNPQACIHCISITVCVYCTRMLLDQSSQLVSQHLYSIRISYIFYFNLFVGKHFVHDCFSAMNTINVTQCYANTDEMKVLVVCAIYVFWIPFWLVLGH